MMPILSSKGFTLLEVMIAFSIIAIVLTTLWGLHSKTVILNLNAQFDTQAPFLAEIRMAQVIENIKKHEETEEGDFGEDFPGYTWKSTIQKVESEAIGTYSEKLKRIEVAIGFNDGEFNYSITSYRLIQD